MCLCRCERCFHRNLRPRTLSSAPFSESSTLSSKKLAEIKVSKNKTFQVNPATTLGSVVQSQPTSGFALRFITPTASLSQMQNVEEKSHPKHGTGKKPKKERKRKPTIVAVPKQLSFSSRSASSSTFLNPKKNESFASSFATSISSIDPSSTSPLIQSVFAQLQAVSASSTSSTVPLWNSSFSSMSSSTTLQQPIPSNTLVQSVLSHFKTTPQNFPSQSTLPPPRRLPASILCICTCGAQNLPSSSSSIQTNTFPAVASSIEQSDQDDDTEEATSEKLVDIAPSSSVVPSLLDLTVRSIVQGNNFSRDIIMESTLPQSLKSLLNEARAFYRQKLIEMQGVFDSSSFSLDHPKPWPTPPILEKLERR